MTSTPQPRSRIVVALDVEASDVPLDIARHLLRDAATELIGVFVEDRRLLEYAAAALAREVGYSGRARAFDAGALERQFRVRAEEARRRFEVGAASLKLPHDFHVLRGDVVAELVREAASAEALVLGSAVSALTSPAWWSAVLRQLAALPVPALLLAREGWQTGSGIVAAIDDLAGLAQVLETGVRLAHRSRSPLTLLFAAEARKQREAALAHAAALAAAAGVELRAALSASELTVDTVTRAARGARLVMLQRHTEPRALDLLTDFLTRTQLPLLLVDARPDAHESSSGPSP